MICIRPGISALALAAAMAATFPGAAMAQTGARSAGSDYSLLPYTHRGYVGILVGKPEFKAGCGLGGFTCDDPSVAGSIYTGGMFNDWIGLELGYVNTGRADRGGGRTRAQGVNLRAVLRVPVGGLSAFVKGGGLYGQTRVTADPLSGIAGGKERGWGASYGGGIGYDFTARQGVVLEWSRHQFRFPGEGRQDVDTTSLGYVIRF